MKYGVLLTFAALLAGPPARADVDSLGWAWGVGCESSGNFGSSIFTATTSGGFTGGGTCTRTSTGYTKFSFSTMTGGAVHATDRYALHTGDVLITQAVMNTEQQPIFAVRPGCPVGDLTLNWIFVQWDDGSRRLVNNYLLGTASYSTTSGIMVTGQYDIYGAPYFLGQRQMPGTCSNGVYATTSGSPDLNGTVYFSPTGAGAFKTTPGHATFFFEQKAASPATQLNSRTAPGLAFDSRAASTNRPVEVQTNATGSTWTIRPYLNPETGTIDTTYTDTVTIAGTNLPQNGMLIGLIARTGVGAGVGKIACLVNTDFDTRVLCSGENPSDTNYPYSVNFVVAGTCPANYVRVPKNYDVEVYNDFCVAKYEMKDVGGVATSQTASAPWLTDRTTALTKCQGLGARYDVVSNAQWQALARNIEDAYSGGSYLNWSNGSQSGANFINTGHTDNAPPTQIAAALDNDPCNGTGQTNCANQAHADFLQKRTHQLSNGEILWDVSGNGWEWVRDDVTSTMTQGTDGDVSQETWIAGTRKLWGPRGDYTGKSGSPWGGLGDVTFTSPTGTIVRGSGYSSAPGGLFYSRLDQAPSSNESFRCVWSPLDDTQPPAVRLVTANGGDKVQGSGSFDIRWSVTDLALGASPVKLEWACGGGYTTIEDITDNTGSYTWTPPAQNSASCTIRITATDLAGNQTVKVSELPFLIDSTPPVFAASQMSVLGGATTTSNANVPVSMRATDAMTNVSHFCMKYNDTATPTANASCWIPVNATLPGLPLAPTMNLQNHFFRLGLTNGPYVVYGWAKDEVGNISALTSAGAGTTGTDKTAITYATYAPPTIINVWGTATDAPSTPFTTGDLTFGVGADVYIKWNVNSGVGLAAGPIGLYYTTDDTTWTAIATGLSNIAGAGCTVGGSHTGCYRWTGGAPAGSYFKIRVVATDTQAQVSFGSTFPLRVPTVLNFLAGSTEPGLGATASSAVFVNDKRSYTDADASSLVVMPNGRIYFRDWSRGIFYIDPSDGSQRMFIPITGTATGDGGPVSSATLARGDRMILDYQNGLLVFDFDRIRRINLDTMQIDTFIGGGGSTGDGVGPLSVQITPPSEWIAERSTFAFFALPNGDVWFQSDTYPLAAINSGVRYRVYKASLNQVTSLIPSGTGFSGNPTQALAPCSIEHLGIAFDPATSSITKITAAVGGAPNQTGCDDVMYKRANLDPVTGAAITPYPANAVGSDCGEACVFTTSGRDGKIYGFSPYHGQISRYNVGTNDWTTLLGPGVGNCADGTAATSCENRLNDVFVDAYSNVYFMDAGRLRTIDTATGTVVTLMGQPFYYGDGGSPLSARFGTINAIAFGASGAISILDTDELRFREFTPGGTITTIAGNSRNDAPDKTNPAASQGIMVLESGSIWDQYAQNPSNGDIYFNRGTTHISKLDRATSKWVDLVGGGATSYPLANGLTGGNVLLDGYPARITAFDAANSRILAQLKDYDGSNYFQSRLNMYAISNGLQTDLAGNANTDTWDFSPDSTVGTASDVPNSHIDGLWDTVGNRWLLHNQDHDDIRRLAVGGNIQTLTTVGTGSGASGFTFGRPSGVQTVYFCDNATGRLRKKVVGGAESALSWPVTGMSCTGRTILYNASTPSIIFTYRQNGLTGVAEYLNP